MSHTLRFVFLAMVSLAVVSGAQEKERSRTGYLGVSIQDITERLVKEKSLRSDEGAYILGVTEDSPADSAGLKKGDVVTEFAGRTIYDADDLSKAVSRTKPGTRATMTYLRDGQKKSATVIIGKTPRRQSNAWFFNDRQPRMRIFQSGHGMLGLGLLDLNEQLGAYFGAPDNQGVLVERVEKDGAGDKAGIKAGDVLLKIGSRTIEDIRDVSRALEKYDEGEKVDVELLRKGAKKTVTIEVEETDEGPWGVVAPSAPHPPMMEMFRGHEGRGLEDLEFELPRIEGLQRRLEMSLPKIEIDSKRLEQQIRRSVGRLSVISNI